MSIYESFSYNGSPFQLVFNDTIGFIQGSTLVLWDLATDKKDYIHSQKNGFQSFVAHPKKGIIVVAEYSLNPKVFIYSYPQKKLLRTLENVSELEIIQMDISFDGKKLLVVNGVPKFEIQVYDLETGQRLSGTNSSIPLRNKFIKAQFSPSKDTTFCVLYENNLVLCEIFPSFEVDQNSQEVLQNIRIDQNNKISEKSTFKNFIWDEQNNIYLADEYFVRYLNGTDLSEIMNKDCEYLVEFFVLTQKHLIIILQNGKFEWIYKYDPANLNEDEIKPFKLEKTYLYDEEKLVNILYNQTYSKLYAGSNQGSIIIFPVEGETFDIEEEEEQQDKENENHSDNEDESREIEIQTEKKGPYPFSPIVFIRELENQNVVITVTQNSYIYFWDIEKKIQVSTFKLNCTIVCGDIHPNSKTLILGSSSGVIRILDISNLNGVHLLKQIKVLKDKPVSNLHFNPDGSMFFVSSTESKKIYLINSTKYNIIGYIALPAKVNTACWNTSQKLVIPTHKNVLFVLLNYFLISLIVPDATYQNKDQLKIDNDVCPVYARKIDPDMNHIAVNQVTGDILMTGKDKIVKRYKQPEELYAKMDTRIKVGGAPIEEQDGHPLPTNAMIISDQFNLLITGGQDGSIYLRNLEKLSEFQQIKSHNWKINGVSTLDFSKKYKLLYSGGYDGSFFAWSLDKVSFQNIQRNYEILREDVNIQDLPDEKVMHYQKVLEEELIKSKKEVNEQSKKVIEEGLKKIQNKLLELLDHNKNEAEELEKLERDDFVIDIDTKNKILDSGKQQRKQIKETAKRENLKQEIIHSKIKEKTWDQMAVQLKGINGLKSKYLVYNYHIRKRTADEERKLKIVKDLRRIEIREQKARKEAKDQVLKEIIPVEDLIKKPEEYIINAGPGKQKLVLIDYEKKEETKDDKNKGAGTTQTGPAGQTAGQGFGGRARHGAAQAKKEEKKVEEVHHEEKEKKEVEEKEEEKKDEDDLGEWDFLYGAFELFTNNRKRNQIIILQNIIFKVKEEFNKEFDKMMQQRQVQVDMIAEKNKRIQEILHELHKEEEIFEPNKNILENPERVLEVDPSEIAFKKFLTREEREKIERDRLREEERQRALKQDDAGVRALKDMMGGTLEEKKENPLDEGLEMEEWMNKPLEEMNEEERVRFKEYEVKKQRLEEEKEKIRKNLENELKKLKSDVNEICQKFDEKLLLTFKRKLEFDYRVYEQELYIVKLAQQILKQQNIIIQLDQYDVTINKLTDQVRKGQANREILHEFKQEVDQNKNKLQDQYQNSLNVKPSYGVDPNKIRNIWVYAFEEQKKDERKKKEIEDKIMNDPKYRNELQKLDPFIELNKKEIKKKLDGIFDSYVDDIREKITNMQMFEKQNEEHGVKFIKDVLQQRFQFKKELDQSEVEFRDINNSITNFENDLFALQQKLKEQKSEQRAHIQALKKGKSNIELIIRFKQGFVEIPSDKPVPSITDAILIPRDEIEKKNKRIDQEGKKKIRLMEDIKNIKFEVAEAEYDLKKRDLNEQKVRCSTREVQLLRVKKEMQVALTKKDMRLNESALKNLQEQIEKVKQATDKLVNIYEKKCKKIDEQIEFIRRENEQLRAQGVSLRNTVQQEEKFSATMFKKNQQQGADDKTDFEAYDKFKQIMNNRQLFTRVKRQTEEIELLREELGKLKARTFANFTAVQKY
ncbi:hypothetical protein TTHERM_00196190 (macronuclear) [Tetrahymena thermophila SB210]|uniref:Cilia- and flagella-associated protein 43 n=1 Tax=Tetrahymena thermophila (strain SB210) TaxID=312017 RepID=Q23K15_TETTS|nr:hypothetical protein TTHERM_00196190 [Tetrahymena thermophila SB210]EAR97028.3 hypothetical protein TTHERM_00196190 [Tetrahymena thermophila SB210]|eukprot:XP_001017273.3 hypothetical protein TTHERM_00196190 [Tetrahymena thermophila SB210]